MKLKVKKFNWLAGRPVVVLNEETSKILNTHVDERVCLQHNSRKIYAVVDIFPKLVKKGEIGISNEISSFLGIDGDKYIEVTSSQMTVAGRLIKKKLSGEKLTEKEMNTIISEIVHNNLTESEISYFIAAEKIEGMSSKEIIFLTEAMVKNGTKLKFKERIIADKHCIGGIAGNRTTPIVVSICASAGLTVPKNSSRAITSASGTADVIETLANVEFNSDKIKEIVKKVGACLVWSGSLGLAPSDDKIIHVERILNLDVEPQLLSSIISKKIAAGSNHILIDIPYGKGAKEKTKKSAEKLAQKFQDLGKHFNLKIKAVLTDGNLPIGNGVGPILEMKDVLAVLKNDYNAPEDLKYKSIFLASELMSLCGIKNSKQKAEEILFSGKAYEKFKEIINTQNNSNDFDKRVSKLKSASFKKDIHSSKSGKLISMDNKKINSLCRILGTPETTTAGVYLYRKDGRVSKGEKIFTMYSESKEKLKDALSFIKEFGVFEIK